MNILITIPTGDNLLLLINSRMIKLTRLTLQEKRTISSVLIWLRTSL